MPHLKFLDLSGGKVRLPSNFQEERVSYPLLAALDEMVEGEMHRALPLGPRLASAAIQAWMAEADPEHPTICEAVGAVLLYMTNVDSSGQRSVDGGLYVPSRKMAQSLARYGSRVAPWVSEEPLPPALARQIKTDALDDGVRLLTAVTTLRHIDKGEEVDVMYVPNTYLQPDYPEDLATQESARMLSYAIEQMELVRRRQEM